jgi:hypothetical protein
VLNGSNMTVSANATDNVGIIGVQFKLDGADLGSLDTSANYMTSWDTTSTSDGPHKIAAVARDAAGNTTTSAVVNVTVNNSSPPPPMSGLDATPPTVPTGLTKGRSTYNTISLSWDESEDPVVNGQVTSGVDGYKLYRNGKVLIVLDENQLI